MRFAVAFLALAAGCTKPTPDGRFLYPGGEEDFGLGLGSSDSGNDAAVSAMDMPGAPADDMAGPADLDLAPGSDMAQECGKDPGEPCCAVDVCEVRDRQSRFLVCKTNVCELCGVQGAYCCAGNVCYGATTCAAPPSMYAGTCR
jgi:hypothetical protein